MNRELLTSLLGSSRIYDLGLPLFQGMPTGPNHPPFLFSLTKLHGDVTYRDGASASSDMFSMGAHVGTHLDALGHVSRHGKLNGGLDADSMHTLSGGLSQLGIDTTGPIVRRGVLLDIPALRAVDALGGDDEIGGADLQAAAEAEHVAVEAGDVVLVRTGWKQKWPDKAFMGHPSPGVTVDGASWLISRGVSCTGADTPAYEKTPARGLAVHLALMVDADVQIIEMLDLEELARDRVYEFLFVALPLKIVGGTASPIRPIAIA